MSTKHAEAGEPPSLFDGLKNFFLNLNKKASPESSLRESLDDAINEVISEVIEERGSSVEDLRAEERLMFQNIIKFGAVRVEAVMVPRADIVGVELDTPLHELVGIFHAAAHSRLPVYRETLDEPIGMVHIKDVLGWIADADKADIAGRGDTPKTPKGQPPKNGNGNGDAFTLTRIKRDVLYVPPSMPIIDLLIRMQATHIHMALVVDEYGGTDGLVTIEDLMEQIVGEIEDEHDIESSPILTPRARGGIDADARVPIEELEKLIGRDLSLMEKEEDIDTLGGLVFSLAGRVPERGELIAHPQAVDFEVVDADPRRIKKLRILVRSQAIEGAPATLQEKPSASGTDDRAAGQSGNPTAKPSQTTQVPKAPSSRVDDPSPAAKTARLNGV